MNPDELAARLRATFATELEDQLRAADAHLLALESDPANANELRGLFRVMHTLKGAALAAGVPFVEKICHAAETSLASVRDEGRAITSDELAALFGAVDALRGVERPPVRRERVAVELNRSPETSEPVETPAPPRQEASVRVAADRLDTLLSASNRLLIASGRASSEASALDELRDEVYRLSGAWRQQNRVIRQRLADRPETRELTRELDRLEARLRRVALETTRITISVADTSRTLGLVTTDMSDGVRVLRLRPFNDAVDGIARMVRDIGAASGKAVKLEVRGTGVDADRSVLDLLREAIMHLVRNAVDHGIETPAARRAAGKPEAGTITIEATVAGDRMRVTVSDDGGGIDVSAIRRVLARRGADAGEDDRSVVARLLLGEGISTRAEAGTISGRGVGLDAANTAVQRARGRLSVDWEAGKGTTFTIDTPLTLATIRAILLRVGDLTLACPTSYVDRLIRVAAASVEVSEGRAAVKTPNGPAMLTALGAVLGTGTSYAADEVVVALLLIDTSGRHIALRVDELIGEGEVVVRPIRAQGGVSARHISGAALLSDGTIALVLNVPAVIDDAAGRAERAMSVAPRAAAPKRKRVLVVDDSITTRTLEQSVLEAAGYDVITAVDGADGWRLLQERGADLVVADVEMPRMDGLELCRSVRASHRFANLPFVLITALESAADRAKGMEAGADAYLGKSSFEQTALVDVLRELLGA